METSPSKQLENPAWRIERIFFSGDEYFASLLEGIAKAKSSIYFEFYIFSHGEIGEQFCQALCAASQRGVTVKILLDGIGSPSFMTAYEDRLKAHRVEVHFYRSIPWDLKTHSTESMNPIRRFLNRLYRLNHGTHRKYCLIDHHGLWVGSYNICNEHSERLMGDQAWKDVGLYVEGPQVALAKSAFLKSFSSHRIRNRKLSRENNLIVINQTRSLKKMNRSAQYHRLHAAKKKIWIETPYFVPLAKVLRLLIKKQKAGVDVRVIVPKRNDVWLVKWLSYTYLFQLARRGVKVYEYSPKFLHGKIFAIDDWICVGSTNLNHRSFLHDLEMDVVLTHEASKQQVLEHIEKSFAASIPLNQDIWSVFPWWKRVLSRILSIFSYWS